MATKDEEPKIRGGGAERGLEFGPRERYFDEDAGRESHDVEWRPPVAVKQVGPTLYISVGIGDIGPRDYTAVMHADHLAIEGEHDDAGGRRRQFRCLIDLPGPILRDTVQSQFENGVLSIAVELCEQRAEMASAMLH